MATAEFLIVRIIPTRPVNPQAFRAALENITVTALDKRVADPQSHKILGSASGLAQPPAPRSSPDDIPTLNTQDNAPRLSPSVIQHFKQGQQYEPGPVYDYDLLSVATVVIVIDPSLDDQEYPTADSFDLRFKLEQARHERAVVSRQNLIDFNVQPISAALSPVQSYYMRLDTAVYISVDVPPSPLPEGSKFVTLSRDGKPPGFAFLRDAINAVLAKDSPGQAPSLETMTGCLTTANAHQIASELIWNRSLDPAPPAPYSTSDPVNGNSGIIFEDMYTVPVNDDLSRARSKFEGERSSYYALHNSDSLQLANYVFSVIAAVCAEFYTATATRAIIDVPVKATIKHTSAVTSTTVCLAGSSPRTLDPAFTVPAAFFYALTSTYAISQDYRTRIKVLLTSSTETLKSSMALAIDAGVLGTPSQDGSVTYGSTLASNHGVNINQFQAIRRIVALRESARDPSDNQVDPDRNADIKTLVTGWLGYLGSDEDILASFWQPRFPDREYLVLTLEIIAPNEETLIETILRDLQIQGRAVETADDLLQITEQSWLCFFTRHQDLLPEEYRLGGLADRVHSFVQNISKVLFVAPNSGSAVPPSPDTIPSLEMTLDSDVLVQFFNCYQNFSFSDSFDNAKWNEVHDAALQIFSADEKVAAFVATAVKELWTVYNLTNLKDIDPKLHFSYMEALHSRGLTSVEKVRTYSQSLFPATLEGTVAYPRAADIYTLALSMPSELDGTDSETDTKFMPVNSGDLVNCEPPCYLSPFGPVQYLSEILTLSSGQQTIGDALVPRRGDLGSLLVSEANLITELPLIDVVNENLEALGSTLTGGHGAVYNTFDSGLSELGAQGETLGTALSRDDVLRALPQHSSPHLPLDQPPIYDTLKSSIDGPHLPYSQALDVCRSYLKLLHTSRFETIRTFHRDITELAQDASKEPNSFQRHLWRLPVRYEIALEYLGISPGEASILYRGDLTTTAALKLLGQSNIHGDIISVPVFLEVAGISYCEFLDLWRTGIVSFKPGDDDNEFPPCLPCCPKDLRMSFPGSEAPLSEIVKLAIFIRLWRSLETHCGHKLPMVTLADICKVLQLFTSTNVNPDFLRQFASLMMLREFWQLPWRNEEIDNSHADRPERRTTLLALWAGMGTGTDEFEWAVHRLLDGIEAYSLKSYRCPRRSAAWRKIIAENMDDLASLAGFDGPAHDWYSKPTCTIRFVEVLSKLYVSKYTVGEILFLFTTKDHLQGDDPYPITEEDEAYDDPLNVPEDNEQFSLWALRQKLLEVNVCDEEVECWTWPKIESAILDMGYESHNEEYSLTYLAEHFFAEILEEAGHPVSVDNRRFKNSLPTSATSPQMWQQADNCSPFHYQALDQIEQPGWLWTTLPLRDHDFLRMLRHLRQLNQNEADAVRDLYWKPRAALAPFALLFCDFNHAVDFLVQEPCVSERFKFFQCEFAKFYQRCKVIAHHLHDAVCSAAQIDNAECECMKSRGNSCSGMKVAWHILVSLVADENTAQSPWEAADDSGEVPNSCTWGNSFSGSAFSALLGLTGTGITGEYRNSSQGLVWKDVRGGLSGWGPWSNYWNTPVIAVIPSLTMTASTDQSALVSFKNGFALDQASGEELSGAEPFTVIWTGILVIENDGCYHFAMRCAEHQISHDECHCQRLKQWVVNIQRGQKTWFLLNQGFAVDEPAPASYSAQIPLRRGAYDLTIRFRQPEPDFNDEEDLRRFHTGFQLKYTGPDTDNCLAEVPIKCLYIKSKTCQLGAGLELSEARSAFLDSRYIPTLRDVRRTYQRAFKATLFAHRFCLSACRTSCECESELGYFLAHPDKFCGTSYYSDDCTAPFKRHLANLDFNFLPVTDAYDPPPPSTDQRVSPTKKHQTALFDWFERIFDYTRLRHWVHDICKRPIWLLFYHVDSESPRQLAQLVGFLGIEIAMSKLVLEYFNKPSLFELSNIQNLAALADERWAYRVWKAGRWLHYLKKHFYAPTSELARCRPALWASTPDPNTTVDSTTGNVNLTHFVQRCCLAETDANARLQDIVNVNNGLRLRAQRRILEYLSSQGLKPQDVSDLLLTDVNSGITETTTRIADAISATQRFVQRAILGIEPSFPIDDELYKKWECELATFDKWQARQRRRYYYENWVQWDEAARLDGSEGFRALRHELKADVTTVALPVSNMFWTDNLRTPCGPGKRSISGRQSFTLSKQQQSLFEGLQLIGTPDQSARPSWLAPVSVLANSPPADTDNERRGLDEPRFLKDKTTPHKATELKTPLDEANLPGLSTLKAIPLWIQSALRVGVRFIRLAASSVPVAVPNNHVDSRYPECCQCGKEHPPVINEYYFWLQDARRFDPVDAPAPQDADQHVNSSGISPELKSDRPQIDPRTIQADPTSDWDAPTPNMLFWKSEPMVHLFWTRVHMGQLQDPRRSIAGISLADADISQINLNLQGRGLDSLTFTVRDGDEVTGFRYDIATDSAVVLPEAVPSKMGSPLPLPCSLSSTLTAFPYFLYFDGGAPLVPVNTFSTSLVLASSFRADCQYEASSRWIRVAYDPLSRDNTWSQCPPGEPPSPELGESSSSAKPSADLFSAESLLRKQVKPTSAKSASHRSRGGSRFPKDGPCCPTSPVVGGKARARAAVLEYLETLLVWADTLRCSNSLESNQQALSLLNVMDRVLGPIPTNVDANDYTREQMTVATFEAYSAPLNPRLISLYERVADGLTTIHASLNKHRVKNGVFNVDLASFGSHHRYDLDSPYEGEDVCELSCRLSCCQPYRFNTILSKAIEWAGLTKATGAALLTAFEKADSEALTALRTTQERQITELGLDIFKNNYRGSDWDVQALDKQMASAVTRLQYYQKLIQDGLSRNEMAHAFTTAASMGSRTSATVSDGIAQGMTLVPDMWVGIAGAYGSPLQFEQMPVGVKMGTEFVTAARILNTVADISASSAGLSLTQAGWDRREQDWQHQCDVLVYEIQQIKRQRLAAKRRLDNTLKDLNNNQRRIEHSTEVQDFLRDKLTKYDLYLYLQQENATLYRQIYKAAVQSAREAQQAARYELGDPSLDFIPSALGEWDSLHEGLLAGENLELALRSLERAYMNKNCREYELTKHISLRLYFPAAFVLLKTTGYCDVDLPEWFFDLDYPGHYMRRIKSVSMTIPCVAGPYTGIQCRLQQLSSLIRERPELVVPEDCNYCRRSETKSLGCKHDPHVWTQHAGMEAIATSSGQNDAGLFEVSFSDARYLPFEFSGAVSRWRIELPPDNNRFDFDSLSDMIMHVNFTAREGGPNFARRCSEAAQTHLPGDGWRFFDIRHEMPDVWNVLRRSDACEACTLKIGHGEGGDYSCCCTGKESSHSHHHDCRVDRNNACEKCSNNHEFREELGQHRCDSQCWWENKPKRPPRHTEREFHLVLTRQMFPFLTGRRDIVVTGVHLLIDKGDCDKVFMMKFNPPTTGDCRPVTTNIPFVQTAGGIWKGSIDFSHPVRLPDRSYRAPDSPSGVIGSFNLPCGLKNVCGAWLLCGYKVLGRM